MPGQNSIHELNDKELDIYFRTLTAVANIDGEFDRKERAFIEDQARLIGFNIGSYLQNPDKNLEFLNEENISPSCGKVIVRDCMLVCYADGIFNDFEKKAMMNIAGLVGVDDNDFMEIDEWRSGMLERL